MGQNCTRRVRPCGRVSVESEVDVGSGLAEDEASVRLVCMQYKGAEEYMALNQSRNLELPPDSPKQ